MFASLKRKLSRWLINSESLPSHIKDGDRVGYWNHDQDAEMIIVDTNWAVRAVAYDINPDGDKPTIVVYSMTKDIKVIKKGPGYYKDHRKEGVSS